MSLNGLDDPKLADAYQSALSEAGGWFLLKYTSRDEVEILQNGKGGLAEARAAVASYEKRSPLYGLLLYRRRKVLIKYIPEGTSRLLQARVTVHFQSVTEKFSPYDTIFPISASEDLNDTTLTAACALHTEKPPSSAHGPSASSPRKKLDEITEDAEEAEEQEVKPEPAATKIEAAESIPSRNGSVATARPEPLSIPDDTTPSLADDPPLASASTGVMTPATDIVNSPVESIDPTIDDAPVLLSRTSTFQSNYEPDARLSSQTLRPTPSELFNGGAFAYKPKIKLGPRPKQTGASSDGRPKTAGARPVSTLPAGLKIAPRKSTANSLPKSRELGAPPNIALPPPPPIPTTPTSVLGPHSPMSVRSLPAVSHHHRFDSPGITPEKQRLMKAVEMRKKQLKAKKEREAAEAARAAETTATSPEQQPDEAAPPVSVLPPPQVIVSRHSEIIEQPPQIPEPEEKAEQEVAVEVANELQDGNSLDVGDGEDKMPSAHNDHRKSDSAVEMPPNDSKEVEEQEQSFLASASSPTSMEDSTTDQSTRPSSVSEEDILPSSVYAPPPKIDQIQDEENNTLGESEAENSVRESLESSPTVVPENGSPVPSGNSTLDITRPTPVIESAASTPVSNLSPSDERDDPLRGRRGKPNLTVDASPAVSRQSSKQRDKRRALTEPMSISAETSDNDYLSDEEFMDELQSATVQQAQPISVSKSPITPFFPNRKASVATTVSIAGRPGSSPEDERVTPQRSTSGRGVLDIARSFSGGSAELLSDRMAIANKSHVSTGISQRIKALAEKSNRDSVASINAVPTSGGSPGAGLPNPEFMRAASQSPPSRSDSVQKPTRLNRASIALFQRGNSGDSKSAMESQPPRDTVHATVYNVEQHNRRPESVSVTARIIRDDRTSKPTLAGLSDNSPLELHQSPLIIDHQRADVPTSRSRLSIHSRTNTVASVPVTPVSPVSREPSTPILPRSSSESSWRSIGRRRSDAKPPQTLLNNPSEISLDVHDEEPKDKKKSRTSRLMKRMSNSLTGASRKGLPQATNPSLKEESEGPQELAPVREPPSAVVLGDLNVQFPDTLLWKRRHVEIDSQGNLVLSVSKTNDNVRGVTKRFHLTELRPPFIPDQDRQELPNSVMLDFLDGSTLQCACETQVAQRRVLQSKSSTCVGALNLC